MGTKQIYFNLIKFGYQKLFRNSLTLIMTSKTWRCRAGAGGTPVSSHLQIVSNIKNVSIKVANSNRWKNHSSLSHWPQTGFEKVLTAGFWALVQAQKVIFVSLTASIDESFTFLVLSIVVKSWFEGPKNILDCNLNHGNK